MDAYTGLHSPAHGKNNAVKFPNTTLQKGLTGHNDEGHKLFTKHEPKQQVEKHTAHKHY